MSDKNFCLAKKNNITLNRNIRTNDLIVIGNEFQNDLTDLENKPFQKKIKIPHRLNDLVKL